MIVYLIGLTLLSRGVKRLNGRVLVVTGTLTQASQRTKKEVTLES